MSATTIILMFKYIYLLLMKTCWYNSAAEDTLHFGDRAWRNQAEAILTSTSCWLAFVVLESCYEDAGEENLSTVSSSSELFKL